MGESGGRRVSEFGPRASITRVGVCEPLPDGNWYVSGWAFEGRGDDRILERGCPYVHGENDIHIGLLGWLFSDLQALSAAQVELSMLDSADRPPL